MAVDGEREDLIDLMISNGTDVHCQMMAHRVSLHLTVPSGARIVIAAERQYPASTEWEHYKADWVCGAVIGGMGWTE